MLEEKFANQIILTEDDIRFASKYYKILYLIEFFLKNQINKIFTKHYTENWFEIIKFHYKEQEKINKTLLKNKNIYNKEFLMNNLTLGFWTGLFHGYYYDKIWEHNNMIKEIFPYLTNKERKLKIIFQELESIRKFRNKIFHFNSIKNDNLKIIDIVLEKIIFGINGKNVNDIKLN